jgi:transcriptional regulator GlxA family with amidase domain
MQSSCAPYLPGGLTSGIDLALHVVERYFGAAVAQRTAAFMEHESGRWKA